MSKPSAEAFDADYFERGVETGKSLYSNFRWMPELTIPLAADICWQLDIPYGAKILDYGCAKGYLVHALRLLHRAAWGVDASEYAISKAPAEVRRFLWCEAGVKSYSLPHPFDWIIAKDVLEHHYEDELRVALDRFRRIGRNILVIVPLGDGEKYHVPAYERDVTHRLRKPLGWWTDAVKAAGFEDVVGSTKMPHVKANYSAYEEGNGFIVARRDK